MDEIRKNTVESTRQLSKFQYVSFLEPECKEKSPKILFVGNSITLHGVKPEIGWNETYGMAASCIENDYVHICIREIKNRYPQASFCICQVSEWERDYKQGQQKLCAYEKARDFEADIIIMRAVENCPIEGFDGDVFLEEYDRLLSFLNIKQTSSVILTTSFWEHPADKEICLYGKQKKHPVIMLGDLGKEDGMKAIGLFEHNGVANHPGDLGMKNIANRILNELHKIYI